MLRPIRHPHIRPRLIGMRVNSTTSTAIEVGKNQATITDNSAGNTTLTFARAFQRPPVVVASCDTDVGSGAIANVTEADTTKVKTRVVSNTSAGSGADGTIHVLALGWDSEQADSIAVDPHTVRSPVISPRLIGFHVDGTGTAAMSAGGRHAALTDNGTGDYTLTFDRAFNEAPVLVGSVIGGTAGVVNVATVGVNTARINTFNAAGAATDFDFYLIALGRDSQDIGVVHGRTVHTPQRLSRMLAFKLAVSGGTPSIAIGSQDAAITDNGAGDFTLTFTNAFKRAPQVIATSAGTDIANIHSASTTACRVLNFNNGGSAADPTYMWVIVLGYDDATEY